MNTRSKTKQLRKMEYTVDIDFDEASSAWRANKKPVKNGCFKYLCCQTTLSGNLCKRERLINDLYCKQHCVKLVLP
jgi:hypothetical protein